MAVASAIGVAVSIVGLAVTYWEDFPPGATIVVLAILVYGVASTLRPLLRRSQPAGDPHPDVTDDVLIADSAAD
jgi:zinc transport system permease protein